MSRATHTEDLQSSGGTWPSTLPNMPLTLSRPGIEAAETLLGLLGSALAMLIGPAAPLALPPWRYCRASAPGIAPTEAPVELAARLKSFFLQAHTELAWSRVKPSHLAAPKPVKNATLRHFFSSTSSPLTLPWSFHVITVSHVNMTHPQLLSYSSC